MRRVILSLGIFAAARTSAVCEHELTRYQDFEKKARGWGEASQATAAVGSVAGGFWGLLGAAPGAVSWRYDEMAKGAKKDYENCLKRVEEENLINAEARRAEQARQLAIEKQEAQEKLANLEI